MQSLKLRPLLLAALWGAATAASAEDIDLFNQDPTQTGVPPNVLFVLDNSANWNATIGDTTKNQMEHQALYEVLTDPAWLASAESPSMRVGLMHFAKSNSPKGGKVVQAVEALTAAGQEEWKTRLYSEFLDGRPVIGSEALEKTNNAPYALMLNEAYRYFAGLSPMSGTADGSHDPAALGDDGNYLSPTTANACAKNFVILIGNGEPDSGEDNDAEAKLRALGGVYRDDPIDLQNDGYESNWGDEYARFMSGIDLADTHSGTQNIITYVIDVHNSDSNKNGTNKYQAARDWLHSIGQEGGGKTFTAETVAEIKAAIDDILNEIQAVNSVFASTTLPVSVNVRGTNLNQVYIGMFRPDAQNRPRWLGNLKLYQLAVDDSTDSVYLADVNGERADSQVTGFIGSSATSFWSHDSSFWSFEPRGTPKTASDAPDGEVVEKGAAAQQLRDDYPGRTLYTCTGTCGPGSLLAGSLFDTSNAGISGGELGVTTDAERTALINWIRGEDNAENEDGDADAGGNALMTDVRASVHGDVLHSRPAVINYNRDGSDNDIIVFYGANDGVFHAIEGGTEATGGHELWGFVPEEFFGKLKRLRDNTEISASNGNKPYFVDGSIAVYRKDVGPDGDPNPDGKLIAADGDKVYLYLTMRRGGRLIYALDVSDPASPKLLWKRSAADAGWSELGQTWSEPRVAQIAYDPDGDGVGTDVLIMGAGYDSAADDQQPAGVNTMGRGILVVNAHTGDVIWQAGPAPSGAAYNVPVPEMVHSIPSAATVIDRDRSTNTDGYEDRVYVGDTGGNLWRVDIADPEPANWKVHRLAAVGGTTDTGGVRKFLYPPDVVYEDGYDAIMIGSGDREHPFDKTVANRFYMFKDSYTSASGADSIPTIAETALYDATANLVQVGTAAEQQGAQDSLDSAAGWYIRLGEGEKVVGGSVTLSGTTFFNTNQPRPATANDCTSNLGIARNYMVSYADGSATIENDGISDLTTADRARQVPGGGYPPSPVPVIVEIDGKKYQAVISGTQVAQAPGTQLETRARKYWYREID